MVLETYNFVMNHRFLRVMILALMVFSLIFCGFMVEYSHAFAWAIPAVEVVATILIACGVMSATDTDLQAVATAFYNSLAGQALSDVITIAGNYTDITSGNFTFKATKAIVNAVADWFASQDYTGFEQVGNTFLGDFTVGGLCNAQFQGMDLSSIYFPNVSYKHWWDLDCDNPSEAASLLFSVSTTFPLLDKVFYLYANGSGGSYHTVKIENGMYALYSCDSLGKISNGSIPYTGISAGIIPTDSWSSKFGQKGYEYIFILGSLTSYIPLNYSGTEGNITTFPNTNVKSDTTYFPKEVVDSAGATTTFPSNTASKPLTTETPLTIPQEGVNSTTLPTDVRTDAGTSEGEQTGTIIGWLEKVWDGVCAIPDAIAGAGTAVIDFVTDLVVPSDTVWDDFMTDVVDIVSPPNTVNFNKYVSSIAIPDVTVNWKGRTLIIVDNSNLRNNVTTWRKYIGAFLAVLLMIYNYNMFMKLMGLGTLTLTESGRVPDVPGINNLSGNVALPAPKGKR